MTNPTAAGAVPVAGAATSTAAPDSGEDLRLARLHLRLGMVAMARAELEDLEHRGDLDLNGLAALAEARWRTGDLDAAATMATRHLEAGGTATVAIVISAEAAAVAGQPVEARALMERASRTDVSAIDAIFAGMPRRAPWPAATMPELPAAATTRAPAGTASTGLASTVPGGRPSAAVAGLSDVPIRASAVPTPADVLRANAGLWESAGGDSNVARAAAGRPPAPTWVEPARRKGHADPERELEAARVELGDSPERGLLRLALVLRLDPTLAPDVFEAIRLRREPLAAVVRGDAERLMGRHLEAEADFGEAMESIERAALAAGHDAQPEPPSAAEPDRQEDS